MKIKLILIVIISLLILVISNLYTSDKRILRIAACPTYHNSIKELDSKKYEFIFSESTSQSIYLLENNLVDIIISGRTLKPNENNAHSLVLGSGYSFLSNEEKKIYIDQIKNYIIYTDLEIREIKEIFSLIEIYQVENVYNYINEGIIITSWENTDYDKAKIVHLIENNGDRVKLSRQATAYYLDQSINLKDLKTLTF